MIPYMRYAAIFFMSGVLIFGQAQSLQVTFNRAVGHLSSGDYGPAEQGFLAVLRAQPDNVGAIGNLGILYARTNRIDKAIAEYQRALRLSPNDQSILLNLGLVNLREEQHSKALPFFERVLAVDPFNNQARQLRDMCLLYTGRVPPALQDLQSLARDRPGDPQLLFLLGLAYLKHGDSKQAQSVFNRMFQESEPARAQFMLGKASYEAALFPQAEESYHAVLRLDPKFPGIHLELGKVYLSERRTQDAIAQFKQALDEPASKEEANYFLGSLLVRESQPEPGITYLEAAKRLNPNSFGVYLYLGKARLETGQPSVAALLLKKAVELNPDDPNAQYTLARALKKSGRDSEAAQAFARARSLNARALPESIIPGIR